MIFRRASMFLASAFFAAAFPASARADECKLGLVTSVNFNLNAQGRILIPVTIEGASKTIAVDTGAQFTCHRLQGCR